MDWKRATQYALQVLIYLNLRGATDPGWVPRWEIAERLRIPRAFWPGYAASWYGLAS
jgi:DNA-binding IscR family transcriptional regulator